MLHTCWDICPHMCPFFTKITRTYHIVLHNTTNPKGTIISHFGKFYKTILSKTYKMCHISWALSTPHTSTHKKNNNNRSNTIRRHRMWLLQQNTSSIMLYTVKHTISQCCTLKIFPPLLIFHLTFGSRFICILFCQVHVCNSFLLILSNIYTRFKVGGVYKNILRFAQGSSPKVEVH